MRVLTPRSPWHMNPGRKLPRGEVFREEDDRAEVCAYCGGPLTKRYQYFSFDLGHNIRVRDCARCGVTVYQQPRGLHEELGIPAPRLLE